MAGEPKSEREVVARFQEMRQQLAELSNKIADLEAEAHEHDLVAKTLRPMDAARSCYRLVGDVLVQRTVGETLPAVERNQAGIEGVVAKLREQAERQTKQMQEFQEK
jgi:prefoldin subunit 2